MYELWNRLIRIAGCIAVGLVAAYAGLFCTAVLGSLVYLIYATYTVSVYQTIHLQAAPRHVAPCVTAIIVLCLIGVTARYRFWQRSNLIVALWLGVLTGATVYGLLWIPSLLSG